jgi:hypothetical protein
MSSNYDERFEAIVSRLNGLSLEDRCDVWGHIAYNLGRQVDLGRDSNTDKAFNELMAVLKEVKPSLSPIVYRELVFAIVTYGDVQRDQQYEEFMAEAHGGRGLDPQLSETEDSDGVSV